MAKVLIWEKYTLNVNLSRYSFNSPYYLKIREKLMPSATESSTFDIFVQNKILKNNQAIAHFNS